MTEIPFNHKMAAHCESGAVTSLLNHAGLDIDEPMIFGITGAIFFGYFRSAMFSFPIFVLRNKPDKIRVNSAKRLGVKYRTRKFRNPSMAMKSLDALLERNIPVGVQVDFFYMDYIPEYARAHFNAHYIIIVAKKGDKYLVSDSYSPGLMLLHDKTLEKARFAKGPLAPRGMMFYPEHIPETVDYPAAIRKGIKQAAFFMLRVPASFCGIRGIRTFARKVLEWPKYTRDIEQLSHEIMMINVILEERGTGGGGFRFLYAAFLQRAAKILDNSEMAEMAKIMMDNGDRWRDISLFAARIGKRRDLGPDRLGELSAMLIERADAEKEIFSSLVKMVK